jgi:hypothetical protein
MIRHLCSLSIALLLFGRTVLAADPTPATVFRFTEATADVGLGEELKGALNHAVAWGDFDGDGRLDLFLGNFADRPGQPRDGANGLYRQTAGGKFVRFPCAAVERRGRCSGAVFADLDNDGDLDLYVSSNTLPSSRAAAARREAQTEPCRLFRNDSGGKFVDVSSDCGACPSDLFRSRDIGVLDFDSDGLLDLLLTEDPLVGREQRRARCRLFRNRGGLKFDDVTDRAGLPKELPALGVLIADLNGDRRPDFFTCGSNRLFLSQAKGAFKEAESLRPVFEHRPQDRGEDIISGAAFGDLDNDGDLDLVTGSHFAPARVHVYLNEGLKDGVPQFREITAALGIPRIPQKAPHAEVQDFDNDGIPDLYWSAWFAEGTERRPFLCKGLGVKDGLPRYAVPSVAGVKTEFIRRNAAPPEGLGMVYYVNGPAVDYDGDGDLDFLAGIWPEEGSRFFRNETKCGHWLQVQVEGKKMNRMGIGALVRLYAAGKAGERAALLGCQEITLNVGYSSGRPAVAHFGLGERETCDIEVTLPSRKEPVVLRNTRANWKVMVREP